MEITPSLIKQVIEEELGEVLELSPGWNDGEFSNVDMENIAQHLDPESAAAAAIRNRLEALKAYIEEN